MEAQHTKHVTYKIAYHFVWCPKYRKHVLVGAVAQFIEAEIRRFCEENHWKIGALSLQEDHIHLFLGAQPRTTPLLIVNTLKGITARQVFQRFPTVKAAWAGRTIIKVDPRFTSQVCSQCGQVRKKDLSERWHSCDCGAEFDRDVNAAINILERGRRQRGATRVEAPCL